MATLTFTKTAINENGFTGNSYTFTAHGSDYTVIKYDNTETYTLISKRKSLSKMSMPTILELRLDEMEKRTKALRSLAQFIKYEETDKLQSVTIH